MVRASVVVEAPSSLVDGNNDGIGFIVAVVHAIVVICGVYKG
jgi:hypothetical protein